MQIKDSNTEHFRMPILFGDPSAIRSYPPLRALGDLVDEIITKRPERPWVIEWRAHTDCADNQTKKRKEEYGIMKSVEGTRSGGWCDAGQERNTGRRYKSEGMLKTDEG